MIVPFLQAARPDVSIAFLSLGEPDLDVCLSAWDERWRGR